MLDLPMHMGTRAENSHPVNVYRHPSICIHEKYQQDMAYIYSYIAQGSSIYAAMHGTTIP